MHSAQTFERSDSVSHPRPNVLDIERLAGKLGKRGRKIVVQKWHVPRRRRDGLTCARAVCYAYCSFKVPLDLGWRLKPNESRLRWRRCSRAWISPKGLGCDRRKPRV